MQLPNCEKSTIPTAKIVNYLLSNTHPDGRHKARLFKAFDSTLDRWQLVEVALREHAFDNSVAKIEPSPFGVRYVVEGIMPTPDGRSPWVRSVWLVRNGEENPQFVTAYPVRRPHND